MLNFGRSAIESVAASLAAAFDDDVEGHDGDNVYAYAEQNQSAIRNSVALSLVVGTEDRLQKRHPKFLRLLKELNIVHSYRQLDGVGHNLGLCTKHASADMVRFVAVHCARDQHAELTCFGNIESLHETQAVHACAVIVLMTRNDLALPLTGCCRWTNRHGAVKSRVGICIVFIDRRELPHRDTAVDWATNGSFPQMSWSSSSGTWGYPHLVGATGRLLNFFAPTRLSNQCLYPLCAKRLRHTWRELALRQAPRFQDPDLGGSKTVAANFNPS